MSYVIVIEIEDRDYAWEVFDAATDQPEVARAVMVDRDHPESIVDLLDGAL